MNAPSRPAASRPHARGAAALALALASCTEASPPLTGLPAGKAARSQGIRSYDVIAATAHDLDVRISGDPAGRLRVHSVQGDTTQEFEGGERFALVSGRRRVAVRTGGVEHTIAEKDEGDWRAVGPVSAEAQRALGILLAVDVDLAVQGSGLIFDRTMLASASRTT